MDTSNKYFKNYTKIQRLRIGSVLWFSVCYSILSLSACVCIKTLCTSRAATGRLDARKRSWAALNSPRNMDT